MNKESTTKKGTPKPSSESKSNGIENVDCPLFLRKTYHMVDTSDSKVVGWSEDGRSFLIRNVQTLTSEFLPQYFKHNQFTSFVRQLNFYGFRKEKNDLVRVCADPDKCDELRWHFRHENFVRGRPDLLRKIERRMSNKSKKVKNVTCNDTTDLYNQQQKEEVKSLKSEIASLESKLHIMESSIDELSKTLQKKLRINNSNNNNQNKRLKVAAVHATIKEENQQQVEVSPKHIALKENVNVMTVQGANATKEYTNHAASMDLPDLSLATDKDLEMEYMTTSLSRSSSISRNVDESQTRSILSNTRTSVAQDSVEDVFDSIESNLNETTIHNISKEDDITLADIQTLPAFTTSSGSCNKESHSVDHLLKHLSVSERQQFVNKVLADTVPLNSIYERGSFHADDLINALEHMISLDESKKDFMTTIGCDKNNKSVCVKIEF